MKIPLPSFLTHAFKRLAPQSLLARAMLILIVPVLLMQIVAAYVFFTKHWDNVSLHLSRSLAGEIAILVHRIERTPQAEREELFETASVLLGIQIVSQPGHPLPTHHDGRFREFARQLKDRIGHDFTVVEQAERLTVTVLTGPELLVFKTTSKRLRNSTVYIFIGWMVGTSLVMLWIAILFLRGQIRPIVSLARAAHRFGRGEESPDFKPSGAREVRLAGESFLLMRERLGRLLRSRVDMLAGISHDLRTPLSRMKLELAMLPGAYEGLQSDIAQMERMIEEYLDFVRGAGGEESTPVNINALLQDIAQEYRHQGKQIQLNTAGELIVRLKPQSFRRVMTNLIDNALRYGNNCAIQVDRRQGHAEILMDDNGPGIPQAQRELVFQPFRRLEESRNIETGGVGLGLTIVRDIVLAHGGEITLADAPEGGLRVILTLPL